MKSLLPIFRLTAFLEGISFVFLLGIAMPLKYFYEIPEAVKIIGMIHGVLFILYTIFLLMIHLKLKWKISKTILVFLAAFIPFGTFCADFKFFRNNRENQL